MMAGQFIFEVYEPESKLEQDNMTDSIGDYYRVYEQDTRSFDYSSYDGRTAHLCGEDYLMVAPGPNLQTDLGCVAS